MISSFEWTHNVSWPPGRERSECGEKLDGGFHNTFPGYASDELGRRSAIPGEKEDNEKPFANVSKNSLSVIVHYGSSHNTLSFATE